MLSVIVHFLPAVFALQAAATAFLSIAAVTASLGFYRKGHEEGPLLPMTVIRPLRGAEDGLDLNLRSVVDADHEGVLQVLFAMESEEDPAYPVAKQVAADYPQKDVRVVLTGPSGQRMGKIHNMIEALKAAKHPVVAFSDSDMRPDRDVLIATSNAFAQGAEAASALPDATGNPAFTDALIGICFNHYFLMSGALLYKLGLFTSMAGGWIVCHRDFIRRIGGLESVENLIADDLAIAMAAYRLGAKAVLLPRFARIHERGGSVWDLIRHLMKWSKIIRWCTPIPYLALPVFTPIFMALAAWILAWRLGQPTAGYASLFAAIYLLRGFLARIQDRYTAASFFPWWIYPILPLTDLASIGFWFCAFFARTVSWRGKKYRLGRGGRIEVLAA